MLDFHFYMEQLLTLWEIWKAAANHSILCKNTLCILFLIHTHVSYEIRERCHYRVAYTISHMEMLPVFYLSRYYYS